MNLQLFLKIGILAVPIGTLWGFNFILGGLLSPLILHNNVNDNLLLITFIIMIIPWIIQILSVYISIRLWLHFFYDFK